MRKNKFTKDIFEGNQNVVWINGFCRVQSGDWEVEAKIRHDEGRLSIARRNIRTFSQIAINPLVNVYGDTMCDLFELVVNDLAVAKKCYIVDVPSKIYPHEWLCDNAQSMFIITDMKRCYYVPATEPIRVLFVLNRAVASSIMCPGAINRLYRPIPPGRYDQLNIEFRL